MSDETFFGRWSRRKVAARKGVAPLPGREPEPTAPAAAAPVAQPPADESTAPLPPVESLTPESDFAPFMRGDVDPATRGQALKTLFSDPRYNVMDGLDVYIDDYSKPDPLPEGWLEKLNQFAALSPARAEPGAGPAGPPVASAGPGAAAERGDPGDGSDADAGSVPNAAPPDPS